jgi:hypothetical protein
MSSDDWPVLPESSSTKREASQVVAKGSKSTMNTPDSKGFQNSNEFQCEEKARPADMTQQQGPTPNRVLIVNDTNRAWFYPSKGLNFIFSQADKIELSGTKPPAVPNPRPKLPKQNPIDSQRRHSYAEVLTMAFDGDGNRKRQKPGRGSDGSRAQGANDQDRNPMANDRSGDGRSNINSAGRYHSGRERGRAYGGYARGW